MNTATTGIHWVTRGPLDVSNEGDSSMSLLARFSSSELLGRRFFLCTGQIVTAEKLVRFAHSHIIGELRVLADEGKKVTALAVYDCSVPVVQVPLEVPAIRVEIIGDARRIQCTCCDRHERWEISKAAFLTLMQRYTKVEKI